MSSPDPSNDNPTVLFMPGIITPVAPSYAPLLQVLGDTIRPILKDLEVYATEAPPPDYNLQLEVNGIGRAAEAAGADRFHIVGYSGGGACSLAFVAQHPERVRSLALFEPAWIGSVEPDDEAEWQGLMRLPTLPPAEQMDTFARLHTRAGLPPLRLPKQDGPPPPWTAKRPAGITALMGAFDAYKLDQGRFRLFKGPVYYGLGELSTRRFEHEAKKLAGLFPNFHMEEYRGRSHFDPPQRSEPERYARALRELWAKAQ